MKIRLSKAKTEQLWDQYQNMVYERIWSWNRTTGFDVSELESEAYVLFMRAITKWDRKRNFGTFLTTVLNNGFLFMIKKAIEKTPIATDPSCLEFMATVPPEQCIPSAQEIWMQIEIHLHDDPVSRNLVEALIKDPKSLGLDGTESSVEARVKLRNGLEAKGLKRTDWYRIRRLLSKIIAKIPEGVGGVCV
jgi:DNA-directed RNA polymerase specialized sigma24 family protein